MSSASTLRQSIATARSRVRISEQEARRSGAAYVAAGIIGVASKPAENGEVMMKKLSFWGIPGTAMLAILAKGGGSFASGDVADYLNGVGDAAAIIAIANFASGREVAGMAGEDEVSGRRRRRAPRSASRGAARLEEELSARVDDLDSELAALEADD